MENHYNAEAIAKTAGVTVTKSPGFGGIRIMQKDSIIQKLKEQGCRITKQRLMLLDIILEEDCSCCKEIYYKASKQDPKIGAATVYRMINTLEEIGAISRKNMYKVSCDDDCENKANCTCTIELDDNSVIELSEHNLRHIIASGLTACGYLNGQNIKSVKTTPCACGNAS